MDASLAERCPNPRWDADAVDSSEPAPDAPDEESKSRRPVIRVDRHSWMVRSGSVAKRVA